MVLYYSRHGNIAEMANIIARGICSESGCTARVRTVPNLSTTIEVGEKEVPGSGPPYVSHDDMIECDGLVLGSPARFGNIAAPLKYFLESTLDLWLSGGLIGKPAGLFTSSGSLHGGQESTLLSMMIPLFHHGMVLVGLPYSEPALNRTKSGGTPYGASHVCGPNNNWQITDDEKELCIALGKRLAQISVALKN